MTELSHRQQLKKNELAELIVALVEWIRDNRTLFLSAAGTFVGIVVFIVFFVTSYQKTNLRASDKLSSAQGAIAQGQNDRAIAILDEIITRHGRSVAASQARLYKADYLMLQQKYDEAEALLVPVTQNGKPKSVIPLAYAALGAVQENAAKFDKAAATYTAFLDKYSDHFMAPKVYESLARVYELAGSTQEARATYEKLATLYPSSGWSERAQERIAALSSRDGEATPQRK